MLPYGLGALIYGPLARGIDSKKILFFCLSGFSLANLVCGVAANIQLLFLARFFAGVSGAAIIPLSLILIAKTTAPGKRGQKVGGFFSLTFISSLLGLFLSGLIAWRWIFLLPAFVAGLVCLAVYFYFPNLALAREKIRFNYLQALSDKKVLRIFVYISSISFIYHGVGQWLAVYFFTKYTMEQFLISMLLTTISLSGIFGESLGGLLADYWGRTKVINTGVLLMLAALLALLFRQKLSLLFVLMFIWGLGWTFNHAGLSTFLTDLTHQHLYESAGLNSAMRFLPGGLGAILGARLAQRDFNLEFMVFASCLVLLFIFSKKFILKEA